MSMKKMAIIFVLLFVAGAVFGQENTAEDTEYIGSNGKTIKWINRLPETFPKIMSIDYLGKIIEQNGDLRNFTVTTYLDSKNVIISIRFNLDEISIYNSELNALVLAVCKYYFDFLHRWFFRDIAKINSDYKNLYVNLNSLKYIFCFDLYNGKNRLQVQGTMHGPELIPNYYEPFLYTDVVLTEPIFINYDKYSSKVYSKNRINKNNGYIFYISNPYNSITREHNTSYLIYLFFEDSEYIKDIPRLN